MTKVLHMCGGLPRAGSTVLMSILQQNPQIFTTGTDPLPEMIQTTLIEPRAAGPFVSMDIGDTDKAMHGFITRGAMGWYDSLTDKPVIISKSRNWSNVYHMFPDSKYICMIRDLRDVIESFHRVNGKAMSLHTYSQDKVLLPSMTDNELLHYWLKSGNPILSVLTYELPRVVEAYQKKSREILLIKYEDLMRDPFEVLNRVYQFLGEELFEHDLDNIQQPELYEHDSVYWRERTSHRISSSLLEKTKEPRTLGDVFHSKVIQENLPYYQMFYPEVLNGSNKEIQHTTGIL